MKNALRCLGIAIVMLGAGLAQADTVTYTFTGADGQAGTDWTLVDPSGFIPDNTNVVSLLTASTDFISLGVDYGPLIGLGDAGEQSADPVCTGAGSPCFEINMAIDYLGGPYIVPFWFEGTDGTTGTFTEIKTGSTLTISQTPEPRFAAVLLSALGLILVMRVRCRIGGQAI
jgi:hypothetical protein